MFSSFPFASASDEPSAMSEESPTGPPIDEARVRAVLGAVVEREGGAPEGWAAAMARFLERLRARNRFVNLVSRATIDRVLEEQALPSLAALRLLRPDDRRRVLDIGSGGGFPGIPLKILRPGIRLDLVEATGKKAAFLSECITELRFDGAAAHWCRIERPSAELSSRAPFDLALARSVGQEEVVAKAGARLLSPDGALWVYSGRPASGPEEIEWRSMEGQWLTTLRRTHSPAAMA